MRTSSPSLTETVLDLVTGTEQVAREHSERLFGRNVTDEQLLALTDSMEGVRLSRPRILSSREAPEERVTAVAVESERGIRADLFVAVEDDGTLGGFRVLTPTPEPTDARSLRSALAVLDPHAAVLVRAEGIDTADTQVKAVASLVKVFVQLAVMRAVERGELHLGHRHVLGAGDISLLSAGLGPRHVGARITVAELCRLMILRSDNTAMDTLVRLVGREAVAEEMARCGVDPSLNTPLRTMREAAELSWGPAAGTADPAAHWNSLTHLPRVHHLGLDYYAPLTAVASAMEQLAAMSWTPWPTGAQLPPGAPIGLLYKGGNAPGVLAASWTRRSREHTGSLMFAVNTDEPLGMLEEFYAFTCAESMLTRLGLTRQ
ncbi:serine hydrolase [Nocardiopsis halotolerans]|uniref:serine hydrolase n=1 Tax=Nocardiopsis halotolerans TaxID=124252 RepID=UPI000348620F|nr:serine hydrolase [Nocardiopsis halotolerans]